MSQNTSKDALDRSGPTGRVLAPYRKPRNGSGINLGLLEHEPRARGAEAERSEAGASNPGPSIEASLSVSPEERHRMIACTAYFRAERRGFVGGSPAEDWYEAEAEIDALLARTSGERR